MTTRAPQRTIAADQGKQAPPDDLAAPREPTKTYGHRVSLDLTDELYDRLVRAGFDSGRVPHGTLARALVSLGLENPELLAQAIGLAQADVKAARESRRKWVRRPG
jgi:hypothetical protein